MKISEAITHYGLLSGLISIVLGLILIAIGATFQLARENKSSAIYFAGFCLVCFIALAAFVGILAKFGNK